MHLLMYCVQRVDLSADRPGLDDFCTRRMNETVEHHRRRRRRRRCQRRDQFAGGAATGTRESSTRGIAVRGRASGCGSRPVNLLKR